ncbi:MAG TPA: zinc ribbon domain-containing protein [Elusimicrobiota bacterium]|nr:zinc ribbon domain-containing protein [Elusimicrobiota bacterium]
MPLFEYECSDCQKSFELLSLPGRPVKEVCAHCGSKKIIKKISVFSAHSSAPVPACGVKGMGGDSPCGSCCGNPSACGLGG